MLAKLRNIYGLLNSLQMETTTKNISTMYVILNSLGDIITTIQKEEAEKQQSLQDDMQK